MISFFARFLLPLTSNFALTKRSGTRIAPSLSRDCLALGCLGFGSQGSHADAFDAAFVLPEEKPGVYSSLQRPALC